MLATSGFFSLRVCTLRTQFSSVLRTCQLNKINLRTVDEFQSFGFHHCRLSLVLWGRRRKDDFGEGGCRKKSGFCLEHINLGWQGSGRTSELNLGLSIHMLFKASAPDEITQEDNVNRKKVEESTKPSTSFQRLGEEEKPGNDSNAYASGLYTVLPIWLESCQSSCSRRLCRHESFLRSPGGEGLRLRLGS